MGRKFIIVLNYLGSVMRNNRTGDSSSRRRVLKVAGGITIGAGSIIPGSSESRAIRTNTCNAEVCPEIIKRTNYGLGSGLGWEQDGKGALLHNKSVYTQEGEWIHDIGISGAAAGEGWNGASLHGHRYKVQGPQGELAALVGNNQHGVHPKETTEDIVEWANTFLELTVGTIDVGAGWFISVGQQLIDAMSPGEGFDLGVKNGMSYTNVDEVGNLIGLEVSHFHRFFYKSRYHAPKIKARTSVSPAGDTVYRTWKNIEFETLLNTSYSVTSYNPRSMSNQEKRKLGIKTAPEEMTIAFDGAQKKITHLMTRNPFSGTVKKTTTREEI